MRAAPDQTYVYAGEVQIVNLPHVEADMVNFSEQLRYRNAAGCATPPRMAGPESKYWAVDGVNRPEVKVSTVAGDGCA